MDVHNREKLNSLKTLGLDPDATKGKDYALYDRFLHCPVFVAFSVIFRARLFNFVFTFEHSDLECTTLTT